VVDLALILRLRSLAIDPSNQEADMTLGMKWADPCTKSPGSDSDARETVLSVLRHRYVREKQHAMRFWQHADRIHLPKLHEALLSLVGEEDKHAESIGARMEALGEKRPSVSPIYFGKEENNWDYLRTDLDEERRCDGELKEDLSLLRGKFPQIAELLDHLESDGEKHRTQIRELLAQCEPQAVGPT
jgi:bacterioferritin (cytochrome b1)